MGYQFIFEKGWWYRIKEKSKEYPWPWQGNPNRTITIFDDDVLTLSEDGTSFTKHTGICMMGILIPMEDVIKQDKDIKLQML